MKGIALALFCAALIVSTNSGNATQPKKPTTTLTPAAATSPTYVLTAWSELGMHCMDGKDYSVFSVLPPYNTIHAQLLQRGQPPVPITSGVTITYQASADATGSINTHSADKTNFWDNVRTLFLNSVPTETGLAGYKTQSLTASKLAYNTASGYWEAVGIPTVPYDDTGKINAYPMAMVVAKDAAGKVLATAKIVLAVSDEMSCKTCHASGTAAAAKPASGWVNHADPAKDVKLNILRKHDDRWPVSQYLTQLQANGYTYQASLYETAVSGTPILCAACHSTNALGAAGIAGIRSLTADMHTLHGPQINPATGKTLNAATTNEAGCYLCHPGVNTKCQRGAMSKVRCSNCHGNLTKVGNKTRDGWLDVPTCQMCHNSSKRYATTFVAGKWRQTTDLTFATNPNVPLPGKSLYRFSTGHGGAYCSACHGSQHAELPSLQANDNVYPIALQGYAAKITECGVCHTNVGVTLNGGPHGMHTIGQPWVGGHHDYAEGGGYTACAYCHGATYQGSPLSVAKVQRTFNTEGGTKTFPAGHAYSCYDCHNGPRGG
jgi:hypothetical protein